MNPTTTKQKVEISSHLLSEYPFLIHPLSSLPTTHYPTYTDFGVGAYIFTTTHQQNSNPHLLLLHRSPTDSYPLHWESPGGGADLSLDDTLLRALCREVLEETGLQVTKVVDLVAVDEWKKPLPGVGQGEKKVIKWGFLVETASVEEVMLNPEEHCAFKWVDEGEVKAAVNEASGMNFIADQGRNLVRAFEVYRRWHTSSEEEEGKGKDTC
ncbi:NUDIX hydrolase [Aspergillus neoniger CBS 115656]|uniref:Lipase n=1 Tax=Aspergillus neoniger (strain CBS 115656) TaxID=1448310 RepID=A0A318Z7P3_ASPNB|nr:lipase [Aspergillus neoniger CBS 115656]PYH39690.1 lipase [Aspergillus neoniger CBS 115656]